MRSGWVGFELNTSGDNYVGFGENAFAGVDVTNVLVLCSQALDGLSRGCSMGNDYRSEQGNGETAALAHALLLG